MIFELPSPIFLEGAEKLEVEGNQIALLSHGPHLFLLSRVVTRVHHEQKAFFLFYHKCYMIDCELMR